MTLQNVRTATNEPKGNSITKQDGQDSMKSCSMSGSCHAYSSIGAPALKKQNARENVDERLPRKRLIPYPFWLRPLFTQPFLLVILVFPEVAGEEAPLGIAFAGEDVGADVVEEPAVVADDHRAAGEFE
ncbi:MAG: hypothetical protein IPH35_11015 [Rhodoferax sp.]|nr:hypothetical protein [Rhodoferax sp.]